MHRYENRVAIVTGGGSGIGRATAIRVASEGAAVAVVDVDEAGAKATVDEIQSKGGSGLAYLFDVSDPTAFGEALRSIESDLGAVKLLVNNAAVGGNGAITSWDEATMSRAFDVNVKAVMHGTGIVGGAMAAGAGGAIVNIASMAGITGLCGMAPYTATKGAVVALTRSTAMELAPSVRVNAIAPGKIITPFREKAFGVALSGEEIEAMSATYPLQRVGVADDVAAAVAFLGSDDAAFITGVVLPVDGGRTSGFHGSPV